jgi:tRNA nucleotidyltransferase (CCA-adding enzyme)
MKIYLVGGAVRDQLLNYPYHEKDWVVVGATPEQLIEQGYRPVGKDFPVFLHPKSNEEYALARTERKTAPGYKGFVFHTNTSVTLEEDLRRRDLTINAIAKDDKGKFFDPYHGQRDIAEKKLRHVSNSFSEDPVRILRIARFLARYHHLGFSVAAETMTLSEDIVNAGETKHLVAERVWTETRKALQEQDPKYYFIFLQSCGALLDIFPEITNELFDTCIRDLARVSTKTVDPIERFVGFCHALDSQKIASLCKRLGAPNEFGDLAMLAKKHSTTISSSATYYKGGSEHKEYKSAIDDIDRTFKETSAIRKPQRFMQLIKLVIWLGAECEEDSINSFWLSLLKQYQQVDPQKWITQGYTGAALGNKIHQDRLQRIQDYLATDSSSIED